MYLHEAVWILSSLFPLGGFSFATLVPLLAGTLTLQIRPHKGHRTMGHNPFLVCFLGLLVHSITGDQEQNIRNLSTSD
jgi:hypothetical protein